MISMMTDMLELTSSMMEADDGGDDEDNRDDGDHGKGDAEMRTMQRIRTMLNLCAPTTAAHTNCGARAEPPSQQHRNHRTGEHT